MILDLADQILTLVTLLAPLASFLSVCLTPRSRAGSISLTSLIWTFIGFVCALALAVSTWDREPGLLSLHWFSAGSHSFEISFAVSNRSLLMVVVVSFISFLVHLYSIVYMGGDEDVKRYFAMLGFFTFSMQGIVLSDNLLFLFIFWELVGFSSYMLIGHWTKRPAAGSAASKAFIMNRIGDAGFLAGLMIVWTTYGSFSLTGILDSPLHPEWQ